MFDTVVVKIRGVITDQHFDEKVKGEQTDFVISSILSTVQCLHKTALPIDFEHLSFIVKVKTISSRSLKQAYVQTYSRLA